MPTTAPATEPVCRPTRRGAVRAILAGAGLLMLLGLAAVTAPDASQLLVLPAALSLFTVGAMFAGWPRTRGLVWPATGAASLVSLAGTAIWFAGSTPTPTPMRTGGLWPLLETAALMILILLVCRSQRLRLATDLHDFVAHDVSAMVIQAQAARVLLRSDSDEAGRVLDRIESDGQRALASMDRTIRTLRELEDGPGASRTPLPGVADLPDLVQRYAGSGAGPIELAIEPGLDQVLHQEAGTTLYRVVVEALTNVRRHASAGSAVAVNLARTAGRVVLTVTNHATAGDRVPDAAAAGRRRSGVGLAGLAERVEALGGTFTAGPAPAGWQVRAELASDALRAEQ